MDDYERQKQEIEALRDVWRDSSQSIEVRMQAVFDLLDMCNPDDVRKAAKKYLPEMLEGARDLAKNTADPELRREAKEMLAQIEFHLGIERLANSPDGTSTGNPP